jgi:hypothetical protein
MSLDLLKGFDKWKPSNDQLPILSKCHLKTFLVECPIESTAKEKEKQVGSNTVKM